jgi:tripartite-type tricarboxylate transporter receptor subunit TctC
MMEATLRKLAVLFALLPGLMAGATKTYSAENYPTRTVSIIVPFSPGGNTDISARILADALSKRLHGTFIVENRGGAGGMIGGMIAAKATPDGYTLLVGASGPTTISPLLHPESGYDPMHAFIPISLVSIAAIAIVVNPSLPANNVAELIALARAKPGVLKVATAGNGTSGHLATALFEHMAGIQFSTVPFNGGGPAAVAVVAGYVDLLFDQVTSTMNYAQEGKLRALAVTTPQRAAAYPEIPTVAESGLQDYQAETYTGLFAPAGTPKPVIDRLYAATAEALADPDVIKKFVNVGIEAKSLSPELFAKYLVQEHERWAAVVKAANITQN